MTSASVIAVDAATADVLATAAMVLLPEETLALVDDTLGASCLLIDADHCMIASSRWPSGQ